MLKLDLKGVIPPMITPLTPDGQIDAAGVQRLVDHVIDGGVSGLFVLGSSGEGPTLPRHERDVAVRAFVAATRGRVPILVGVGETGTARTLEAVEDAESAGADAVVVMTPLYFLDADERYVARHVHAVAATATVPLLLYNIPQVTGNRFTPALIRELGQLPNVIGLKDSSGDWDAFLAILDAAKSRDLRVFQGAEDLIARSVLAGADGSVPGLANLAPRLVCDLVAAAKDGDAARANALQQTLDRLGKLHEEGFWLAALKEAVSCLGICGPTTGLPIRPVDADGRAQIARLVSEAGLSVDSLGPPA